MGLFIVKLQYFETNLTNGVNIFGFLFVYFRRNTVLVADSLHNDWIFIVKSVSFCSCVVSLMMVNLLDKINRLNKTDALLLFLYITIFRNMVNNIVFVYLSFFLDMCDN